MSEQRRGCGYRKVGGLYLVSEGTGMECCKLPIELHVCPTCNQGVKQGRGWQWIDPKPWLKGACKDTRSFMCPAAHPENLGDKVGLLWIGERFYPSPADFTKEGHAMGWSRRIKTIPRGFKIGEHYVFLAHPKCIERQSEEAVVWLPGVFYIWKPSRIEKIVTDSEFADDEVMQALVDRDITPVPVPDDDPRYRGSVFDNDEQLELRQ
jgi:hypothetical protein